MNLDYKKKKIQKDYHREVSKKMDEKKEPIWVNVVSIIVIVSFILHLYIDWL
ncbi:MULTISPECIES: hypothetical protein [unclassified Mesobacillus]|uniref:hypothetical protein n=1 Tax=unclassified Mesobacillus TaxID=2675270 RepID=UPI00203E3EF0|nr:MULTISPECIES: hypothetical protein [unclassified Mesobacillus]MCM3123547.1 hypothetical protein [Mesobacillus sp. MER 33]MCM3232970.1 hypothetical protein [Mesobacillus sp. MER 48]